MALLTPTAMNTGTTSARQHIEWIDALRVLACFMVVFAHCCDGFVAQFDADRESFLTGVALGSLMRPSVPLFVMITATLLLPIKPATPLRNFYSKRLSRLIIPLIFWSLTLPIAAYCYFCYGNGAGTLNPAVDMTAYTPQGLTNRLWSWVLNFNFDTTPLWYLYMLAGLYLIMPIVSSWLSTASQADIRLFLKVWAITLLLPYIKLFAPALGYLGNYGNLDILGGCDWNAYSTFHYVSGFIGYTVLAYYLNTFPLRWSRRRLWLTMLPMWIVGYAITFGGYVALQSLYPGDYAYLEIVWLFSGINVLMMTLPIYVAMQRLRIKSNPALQFTARLTFGIYLSHFIFVMIAYDIFATIPWPIPLRILAMALTTFATAAFLTYLLRSTRLTSPLVT